ncbi:MAG: hypothetical protein H0U71_08385 [Gammaproteobacteria bacterium]|nr:hypothetical protein [Gammaproteobacteria bacterium]
MQIDNLFFKKIIVLFWTLWWLIALWTDIVGALAHFNLLHASWAPDTNFPFLIATLSMYKVQPWVPNFAFIGILIWSALSTIAFVWASMGLCRRQEIWMARVRTAFIISLSYWLAFFLADQLVMKFDLEQNHMVQGGFELLTFLSLYLLPNKNEVIMD